MHRMKIETGLEAAKKGGDDEDQKGGGLKLKQIQEKQTPLHVRAQKCCPEIRT